MDKFCGAFSTADSSAFAFITPQPFTSTVDSIIRAAMAPANIRLIPRFLCFISSSLSVILAVSIILKDYRLVNIGCGEMIIIRSSFVHYYSTLSLLILPDFFHNSYFLECPASPLLTENHPDSPVHPVKRQKPVMPFQYRAIIILLFSRKQSFYYISSF